MRAADLTVVIPTRDRWPILARTLDALAHQSVSGFDVLVVVDGTDQRVPPLPVPFIVQEQAGPGAARNTGVGRTQRPLVLFLGDDMVPVPALLERHLAVHERFPEAETAVLGQIVWHPDVAGDRLARWLDWSALQFDYANITGDDAGWGRFYSSNVSLKRQFFLEAGGFDDAFVFDYEDLDLAWRLHQLGMRLRYERGALAHHLHRYDWDRLRRRWESHARGERLMQAKHDWFEPFFYDRVASAVRYKPVSAYWAVAADRLPGRAGALARERAGRWYLQRLAAPFLAAWEGEADLGELRAYLGAAFDINLLHDHVGAVEREEAAAADEHTFYRTSRMYLYDLTAFAMTGTKRPYLADLKRFVRPGARLLDYGCGIGSDGLRLLADGFEVEFADFDNPSVEYLRWRLARRGLQAPVHDIDAAVPAGFDAAYALDVIEHVDDPFSFLGELERRAEMVMVNLLEPDPDDTHLHKPLPITVLLDHAHARGILRYRRYYGRSHLVIYRTLRPGPRGRTRSMFQRHLGTRFRPSP